MLAFGAVFGGLKTKTRCKSQLGASSAESASRRPIGAPYNIIFSCRALKPHLQGNAAFQHENYFEALEHYAEAMQSDPTNYIYPLNRSMANLKLKRWSEAEADATAALQLSPVTVKAYFRRSVARREQAKFEGARRGKLPVVSDLPQAHNERPYRYPRLYGCRTNESTAGLQNMAELSLASVADLNANLPGGFTLRPVNGKGLGAFASRPFRRGDLVLTDPPLYIVENPDNGGRIHQGKVITAVKRLSAADKQVFLSLMNVYADTGRFPNPILGIHDTNAFQVGGYDSALCIVASRFNHSCSPNARYSWHAASGRLRIYALRDIAVGGELLVSYISSRRVYGSVFRERQQRLSMSHGFTCSCATCTLPKKDRLSSDQRRKELTRIWESIPYYNPGQTADRLRAIVRAVRLLDEEGYAADADDFTIDAAGICACHSDWASVEYWAMKTYETRVAEFGEDSDRAAEVRSLSSDLRRHPDAGTQRKQTFLVRL
ncbi:hypothetical protein BKA93DRAFT_819723 [Sparassis latifolia]